MGWAVSARTWLTCRQPVQEPEGLRVLDVAQSPQIRVGGMRGSQQSQPPPPIPVSERGPGVAAELSGTPHLQSQDGFLPGSHRATATTSLVLEAD